MRLRTLAALAALITLGLVAGQCRTAPLPPPMDMGIDAAPVDAALVDGTGDDGALVDAAVVDDMATVDNPGTCTPAVNDAGMIIYVLGDMQFSNPTCR